MLEREFYYERFPVHFRGVLFLNFSFQILSYIFEI